MFKKQTFDEQKFWSKNILVQNFGMKTMFCSKNIFVQTHIGINDTKRFKVQTLWSILGLVLGQGQMSSGQRFLVQISLCYMTSVKEGSRNLNLKFGQNWFSNSWDIADMDICRHDKYCLDKCHLKVGICFRCSQEPTFKVRSKLGQ